MEPSISGQPRIAKKAFFVSALRVGCPRTILGLTPTPCVPSTSRRPPLGMSIWKRMFGKESRENVGLQRLDYLKEGLALESQGDFEAALTSYRLAFRDNPADSRI